MTDFIHLQTILELYRLFGLPDPVLHPLVAVVDFGKVGGHIADKTKISADFYSMMFKNYRSDNVKYGRKPIDFQDGSLICMAPNQVIEMDSDPEAAGSMQGWGLFFHPDLLRAESLGAKMKNYSFFSYETAEALHLSDKEKRILHEGVEKIQSELGENVDGHSQAILASAIELLLNYCQRFYQRQFITRKSANRSVVAQVETLLTHYFEGVQSREQGLPTVRYLADHVHLSPGYLSDLLKKETGRSAQDHIHSFVIEKAKDSLLSTDKSVAEIAYGLGFDYPQYFNKLFKQRTGKTPLAFRGLN